MPRNNITDLRNHMFEVLERLNDPDDPMDAAKANAFANVGKQINETYKHQVAAMKILQKGGYDIGSASIVETKKLEK